MVKSLQVSKKLFLLHIVIRDVLLVCFKINFKPMILNIYLHFIQLNLTSVTISSSHPQEEHFLMQLGHF